jgi:hypothetical protein
MANSKRAWHKNQRKTNQRERDKEIDNEREACSMKNTRYWESMDAYIELEHTSVL